jgi:phosphoribosylaminoimidazolecarboxamide formyltransferase/IMP cyclohydrolase
VSNRAIYRNINADAFPASMEISFGDGPDRQTLRYEKVTWTIGEEERGLRYGENPDQTAALYRLVNGRLVSGDVQTIAPGRYLASDVELLQSGKHPGKINITDADSALTILRYLDDTPATVIVKHNNPSGVALGTNVEESYTRAFLADRVAAFGGVVAINRPVDSATAEAIAESYSEVVVAPDYEEGTIETLGRRKNLRIMRIGNMGRLREFAPDRVVEFSSLIDGGVVVQWSQTPTDIADFRLAEVDHKGTTHRIEREPTASERSDMRFGWLVEYGITSNSVIFVKDGVTLGIGTGEQDRVGVAEIARDKAYRKLAERLAWDAHGCQYAQIAGTAGGNEIWAEVVAQKAGLIGATMVSDAFFPFRDGLDVGLEQGVRSIVQPGGSLRDYEIIDACNEAGATMLFTGQRSFRH